ncbi:MAG: DEAD/DEAH box helicase [Bacillota bacterium]
MTETIHAPDQATLDGITRQFHMELSKNPFLFFDETDLKPFLLDMRHNRWDTWQAFLLQWEARQIADDAGDERLLAVEYLRERWRKVGMIPYPHQLKTAHKVLHVMHGRAVLADEVGLGKTIEAGLVIKEYLLRGLAKNALILTPASLCRQWHDELHEKFDIWCNFIRKPADWSSGNFLIASMDTAKKPRHAEIASGMQFDILVIDEAHKLKNNRTQNWQFIRRLRKKFFLLLTATPLQNDLKELYNLITLLRPGQLGSYHQFQSNFIQKKRVARNPERLKELLGEVMIRNRRAEVMANFPKRFVKAVPVELNPAEAFLYGKVVQYIKQAYMHNMGKSNILPLITLQREICSSTDAAAVTLNKMIRQTAEEGTRSSLWELLQISMKMPVNSKIYALLELIRSIPEKIIVFTEFIATQRYIQFCLQRAGVVSINFDGTLSGRKKEFAKIFFRDNPLAKVMVATESGGEGINLQFCHHLINYDLPWNPMRIEQRIGRIHRLGQTQDVHIYNFSTRGTIEEHIIHLLQEKLDLFQSIVEDPRQIAFFKKDSSLESKMMRIIMYTSNSAQLEQGFDAIAEEYRRKRETGLQYQWDWLT